MNPASSLRGLRPVLYAIAALILFDQLAEIAITVWPLRVTELRWRFGLFGLFAGRATAFLLADCLILATALFLGSSRSIRVWAVIHIALGLLLGGALGLFGLDTVQLGRAVRPEAVRAVKLASIRAFVMGGFGFVYCLAAGFVALRGSRHLSRRPVDSPESLLVVKR